MQPVLLPVDGIANFLLAPWQNRISSGGFTHGGRFVALAPNVPGEAFPIHGNAWQQPWGVTQQTGDAATLALRSEGPGIYRYRAVVDYALGADGDLTMALEITNDGPELPFGLGFHPYFPRDASTTLAAMAGTITLQDEAYLPTRTVPTSERPNLRFSEPRTLPADLINNEFQLWNGVADIRWPDRHLGCRLAAPGLTRYVVYSPGALAPFFCFEPVTHSIDAFNRLTDTGGLVILQHRGTIGIVMTLKPYLLP
jgi:aldose 1-epimerase